MQGLNVLVVFGAFFLLTVEAAPKRLSNKCHTKCLGAVMATKNSKDKDDLCESKSVFRKSLDSCLKCGNEAWQDYGHALSLDMVNCSIELPGKIPNGDFWETKAKKTLEKKKDELDKKAKDEFSKADKLYKEAMDKTSDKTKDARHDAEKHQEKAKKLKEQADNISI